MAIEKLTARLEIKHEPISKLKPITTAMNSD